MTNPIGNTSATAAAFVGLAGWWAVGALTGPSIQRLALLPFENERTDPEQASLLAGMHEALIGEMQQAGLEVLEALAVRDGKLYGRGGADDGYALFGSLTAIAALQAEDIGHGRCVVLVEGCEESGSFDLPYYMEALAEEIGTPPAVISLAGKTSMNDLLALYSVADVLVTNDSGPGSLRQAITDANSNPGADTITFARVTGEMHIILAGAAGEDGNVSGDLDILDGDLDGMVRLNDVSGTVEPGLPTSFQFTVRVDGQAPGHVSGTVSMLNEATDPDPFQFAVAAQVGVKGTGSSPRAACISNRCILVPW